MNPEQYIQSDFERARNLYSPAEPQFLGRLTISQEDAVSLPLDLEVIYGATFDTIAREPAAAEQYAATFGKLSIMAALDERPTQFMFSRTDSYRPPGVTEIATQPRKNIRQLLTIPEYDGPTAYLLASDDEAVRVEMALVQAMHMVDTAMVTGRYNGSFPLVRTIGRDELLEFRAGYPDDVLLRVYGNVRSSVDAPVILGSVVPTDLLEKSGTPTRSLNLAPEPQATPTARCTETSERQPATFIGITTAKKPHVGHGFLLARALAKAGENGRVLVELNDNGPRVEQALAVLAAGNGISADEAAALVTDGAFGMDDIQAAYTTRQGTPVPDGVPAFSLRNANQYYRTILQTIMPKNAECITVADSELPALEPRLQANQDYVPLFGDTGMALVRDERRNAVVVREKGRPTLPGIIATLGSHYALTLVDSPPPVSGAERQVFNAAGLGVELDSGTGLMIDFETASGTKGNAQPLDEVLLQTERLSLPPGLVLPAIRQMMDEAYFLPGEGTSLNANFASSEAVGAAFKGALGAVSRLEDPESILFRPLRFREVTRDIVRDTLAAVYADGEFPAKPTVAQLGQLLELLPNVRSRLSPVLLQYCAGPLAGTIPKSYIRQQDRQLFQAVSTAKPDTVLSLVSELADNDAAAFERLIRQGQLGAIMSAMGYDKLPARDFLTKIQSVKGVYKVL